jgi:hypothetical protein
MALVEVKSVDAELRGVRSRMPFVPGAVAVLCVIGFMGFAFFD